MESRKSGGHHSSLAETLRQLRSRLRVQWEVFQDGLRFCSTVYPLYTKPTMDAARLEGAIIRHTHVVEKGLTFREFRPRFGQAVIRRLVELLRDADTLPEGYLDHGQLGSASDVLRQYLARHAELGVDVKDILTESDIPAHPLSEEPDTRTHISVDPSWREGFEHTVLTRTSVREFDPEQPVPDPVIEECIRIALSSPSVCNRQTARVHLFRGAAARRVLEQQNGNRGFGHRIPVVLVITSDLRYFVDANERNQAWVDGGIFSMLLLLALHARGLGAVSLNWSVRNKKDRALRKVAGICEYERVILLIGCGYPVEGCQVARSLRRDPASVLQVHSETTNTLG